jgi:hypothetical protein
VEWQNGSTDDPVGPHEFIKATSLPPLFMFSTIAVNQRKKMDRKKVLLAIVLLVAAIAAVGVSVSVLTGRESKVTASDPTDSDVAVTTGDEQFPTPPPALGAQITNTPQPADHPSLKASEIPGDSPTSNPLTMTDETSHRPSDRATEIISPFPTTSPSTSPPTSIESLISTYTPSVVPFNTDPNSPSGCRRAAEGDSAVCDITVFYAIADVPYTNVDTLALPGQIVSLPDNAEFLIHLGDIRSAKEENRCNLSEFQDVAETLRLSKVPVFIVVGGEQNTLCENSKRYTTALTHFTLHLDNEWNDCSNIHESWGYWGQELGRFEDHWDHNFQVTRPDDRPENFVFIHKKSMFIGLNLVAGRVHDANEWDTRLTEQAMWTIGLMAAHTGGSLDVEQVRSIVIFGHAHPTAHHDKFFLPLRSFILNKLAIDIPVMYMNGDAHVWSYDPTYLGVEQMLRIQLTGGTTEPPLEVIVAPTDDPVDSHAESVFLYDRRL